MTVKLNDKVIFIRSAFLGDFLVCLPVINQIIRDNNLTKNNIYFLIINNSGANPINAIFGDDHIFSKNSIVFNTHKYLESLWKCFKFFKMVSHERKLIYLPMWYDSFKGQILKYVTFKFIFGLNKHIYGIFKQNSENRKVVSQYLNPFVVLGLEFNTSYNCLDLFGMPAISINNKNRPFLIYPYSKLKMKIWPSEKYVNLINKIIETYNPDIFLIGGKDDYEYNQTIKNHFLKNDKIQNIAGTLSVKHTIELMLRSEVFIGNDGFPMHLAAIANLPIIGIFTYKNPLGCWDPIIVDKMITVRTDTKCKLCYLAECDNPICILKTSEEIIFNKLQKLLLSNVPIKEINVNFCNQ